MLDPVRKAYATIGVTPGVSARELKQQYKRLVRQWHPDRWTHDPVGQIDAAEKMRAINDAYSTLHRLLPRDVERQPGAKRSLTKEEMDAIVQAIGTDSPVSGAIRTFFWILPVVGAFLILQPKRDVEFGLAPPSGGDVMIALLFIAAAFGIRQFQKKSG